MRNKREITWINLKAEPERGKFSKGTERKSRPHASA